MKLFECQQCGQLVYFENVRCERCGCALGYDADTAVLRSLRATAPGEYCLIGAAEPAYRYCDNARYNVCNWLVATARPDVFCAACALNRTIPNLAVPAYCLWWMKLEWAKHRLVYTLLRLGLPLVSKHVDTATGLAFDFLADPAPELRETGKVLTGHSQGIITLNVAEADDAERERQRLHMGEPYRTILGHFRHESGHYYWERLLRQSEHLAAFRTMFGDETLDYARALEQHYAAPRQDWQAAFVSAYASAHAWEDWAETWAHYLHIVDTLETAFAYGLRVRPRAGRTPGLQADISFDPYTQTAFEPLIAAWLPLTYAVNSLNRSMGERDVYPFVLTPTVLDKLHFVHGLIHGRGSTTA